MSYKQFQQIVEKKYSIKQLKSIMHTMKIKTTGNKCQLIRKLKEHYTSILIQKMIRGYLQRKLNSLFGPALLKRHLCVNQTDAITLENIQTIPCFDFFSFIDYMDNKIYGFRLSSIYYIVFLLKYEYICSPEFYQIYIHNDNTHLTIHKDIMNPFNRNKICFDVFISLIQIQKISKKRKIPMCFIEPFESSSSNETFEKKTFWLFQKINSILNIYSDSQWYLSLNYEQLNAFVSECMYIWNFRSELSMEKKNQLYPPFGNPFQSFQPYIFSSFEQKRIKIIELFEQLFQSECEEFLYLLSYYFIGSLTIVNPNASNQLPWIYNAFHYD
jgi:hypothetical protein